ncbi:hypothetical protein ACT29H_00870 [Thermophagus sp. OGC60D27]|uniref:Cbp1 family collagen-binding glycoprotein adhesin n=1 Tax=Thermophagus sp. OGC60D27 TaxID=3458415 RepID=UPI00403812A9
MNKTLLVLLILPLLWQCQQGPSRKELLVQNDSLARITALKDSQMNQMVNTIGDIEATLRVIKEKEKIIALKASKGETKGDAAEQINEDIRLIYDLMVQNKERIESLEEQLKRSGVESGRLRKLVVSLQEELQQRNQEIKELNELLKEKNAEIDNMNFALTDMELTLDSMKEVNAEARAQLEATKNDMYTGYYAIGTRSELKEKNIIDYKGFLFFGKTEVLKEQFAKDYFAEIDIRQTDSIELFQPNVKILSTHPQGSFTLSEQEDGNQVLVINDKEQFWSVSRYLVVLAR